MNSLRPYSAALAALGIAAALYVIAKPPSLPPADLQRLADSFAFQRSDLTPPAGIQEKRVREVHPSLRKISAWVSTLGAAVTLADLDGDGLANDIIHVDPRFDSVTVAPALSSKRFEPFLLVPTSIPHNSKTTAPMGTLAGDFNEDGLLDIAVYYWGRPPVLFLRRSDDSKAASPSPLKAADFEVLALGNPDERWFTNAAIQADLDGDGHVDLLFGNYFRDGAEILDANSQATQELHRGKAKALNGGKKHFFLWQKASAGSKPTVEFKPVENVLPEEVNSGWTLAMAAQDLDGDALPEIYMGFDFGPDRLLHNRSTPGKLAFGVLEGKRGFFTPKSCVINRDSFKGMGCDFGDVNGDGKLDIYVSNIATEFGLTESHFLWLSTGDFSVMKNGEAPYEHAAEKLGLARSGWGWDCKFADFNNDGSLEAIQAVGFIRGTINRWPELQALGTSNDEVVHNPKFWPNFKPGADLSGGDRNAFFARGPSGRFENIGPKVGFDVPMVSRGLATADVNGDGLLDFAVANQWGPSYFFLNTAKSQSGSSLVLRLLLPPPGEESGALTLKSGDEGRALRGSPAYGATASIQLPNGQTRIGWVDGGAGHSGRRSPEIHVGLGKVDGAQAMPVSVRWRDRKGVVQIARVELPPGRHSLVLRSSDSSHPATSSVKASK